MVHATLWVSTESLEWEFWIILKYFWKDSIFFLHVLFYVNVCALFQRCSVGEQTFLPGYLFGISSHVIRLEDRSWGHFWEKKITGDKFCGLDLLITGELLFKGLEPLLVSWYFVRKLGNSLNKLMGSWAWNSIFDMMPLFFHHSLQE